MGAHQCRQDRPNSDGRRHRRPDAASDSAGVGRAVATSIVDTFVVLSPPARGPIPIEEGLSACAERGFGATEHQFVAFVKRVDAIEPQPGTTITLTRLASCGVDAPLQPCGGIAGFPVRHPGSVYPPPARVIRRRAGPIVSGSASITPSVRPGRAALSRWLVRRPLPPVVRLRAVSVSVAAGRAVPWGRRSGEAEQG